ncbi:uncharacterized protein LOC120143522 isoform X2 [Hibiscus syriacus]|uniref:uncharacterized protein LOC120143522 isoform X2 n=1 Tax=Hibiscus syriacus TaxID=106335 RepID=UPI00192179F7|nr:uncharacterized protein LOC120143522 isoform X2 [Hibiscus syriacus]
MTSIVKIDGEHLVHALPNPSIQDQIDMKNKGVAAEESCENHSGICAICLDKIVLQETALVKGCEHAYWIHDYMFEESFCLLLRATWFKPLIVEDRMEDREEVYDNLEVYYDYYPYEDEDDEEDEVYYTNSPSLRIGNRRWGDSGYVRSGRQEARPVQRSNFQDTGAGSSREPKKKEAVKSTMGRRAKRTLKREAANKAAAENHQEHLMSRTPK